MRAVSEEFRKLVGSSLEDRVLDTPMGENGANASTIREYLVELLVSVWREREGFSGKRPFGNSSWEYELYEALVKAGLILGTFDEEDHIDTIDRKAGDALILRAIKSLHGAT